MEALASTMRDQNLQITLPYGIGIHHVGLRENDRRIVEELFVNQKIQVGFMVLKCISLDTSAFKDP